MNKKITLVWVLSLGLVLSSSALADQANLTRSQLKECIHYYEKLDEKKGNIQKLGEIMDEVGDKLDSYDYQLDRIDQELSHTIGYKRSALIQEYNSLVDERDKFFEVYSLAKDKREKRIRQFESYASKYDDQCVAVTASRADLDELCSSGRGFCGLFD